jgi:uncharacterized protein YdeI (YjbR/CyaY-like superfamily)
MPPNRKRRPVAATQRFEARLERMRSRLNWIIATTPFDAAEVWGLRGQIKVKGEINGFPFRSSMFPTREGRHILLVTKGIQKGARATEGSVARFRLDVDTGAPTVAVPDEFKRIVGGASREARSLRLWYDELNRSTRNDIAKWIGEPKSAEARVRRAQQIAERLLSVRDAEQELPPVLQLAFARQPRALEGWWAMSAARRRRHLFGIFYYRTPEAQRRRIDKMLEDAIAIGQKASRKKK